MFLPRIRRAVLGIAAALSVSACGNYYDGGYGYGGLSVGYGTAGYYDPYYDDYHYGSRYGRGYGYGYGYAPTYYGWNNGFYYPGTGYYVYDQYRRPYRWNSQQQRYWQDRYRTFRGADSRQDRRELRENWQGFRQERRTDDRAYRQERRTDREAFRNGQLTREQFRTDRRQDRREYRQDLRQDRRELRRENRRDRRN
ncbi:MAG TPA: hypothetical protein VK391_04930 [Allosphingosinicella sp.]|nr:hypothetical protein [Allosphingosinicella sp.]